MEQNKISLERSLAVYKQFYEEEVRKRKEAEEAINSLQKLCQDYFDMFCKEADARLKEVEDISTKARAREENIIQEVESRTRHDTKYSILKFIVESMAFVLIIPVLDKLHGRSWSSFAMELVFFPACTASLIVLIEFIGMKFFEKQINE